MTNTTKFYITSFISFVTGVIGVVSDPKTANDFSQGLQLIFSGILILAPLLYNLEHHSKPAEKPVVVSTEVAQ